MYHSYLCLGLHFNSLGQVSGPYKMIKVMPKEYGRRFF